MILNLLLKYVKTAMLTKQPALRRFRRVVGREQIALSAMPFKPFITLAEVVGIKFVTCEVKAQIPRGNSA